VLGGGTPSKANSAFWKGSIPWVSPKDMKVDRIADAQDHISHDAVAASPVNLIPVGALLMVVRGMILAHSFPTAVTTAKLTVNQDMKALVPFRADLADYLLFVTKALKPRVLGLVEHSTHGTCKLPTEKLLSMPVPFAPLAEQHRIVARVTELMGLLDRLEAAEHTRSVTRMTARDATLAALRKAAAREDREEAWLRVSGTLDDLCVAPEDVKPVRDTILELAVRGRLVPQDERDRHASNLLEEIDAIAGPSRRREHEGEAEGGRASTPTYSAPSGWVWARLGQVVRGVSDGTHHTPTYVAQGVPFLSVKDISGGAISFASTRYITAEQHNELCKRCRPEVGDILLCRIGTLGKAVVVNDPRPFSIFVSLGLLETHGLPLSARYLAYALNSPMMTEQFEVVKAGGSHTQKLNLGDIRRLWIPVPPVAEQHRIVAKVDELMAKLDLLEGKLVEMRETQAAFALAAVHDLDAARGDGLELRKSA
jgi:type I restriction enzyme S subunit